MTLLPQAQIRFVPLALATLLITLSACGLSNTWIRPPVTAAVGPASAQGEIIASVLLIGDAGLAESTRDPVLTALSREIATLGAINTTVVFLGDNVYPDGVPDEQASTRDAAVRRLTAQVDAANEADAVVFVPGNHDHHNSLDNERAAIKQMNRANVTMLPCSTCPVESMSINNDAVHLIAIDTEAWLTHKHADDAVRSGLEAALTSHPRSVVVGHHPLASHGPHGGFYGWHIWEYVRRLGFSRQDLSHCRNRRMRRILHDVFAVRAPLLYASGHEHSLQILQPKGGKITAVSGAGTLDRPSPLRRGSDTLLASPNAGFMRLDVYARGARLQVIDLPCDREQSRWVIDLP